MTEFVKGANTFNLEDFPFELYNGSLPVIGSRYYHFVNSGSIYSNGELIEQVQVYWIQVPYSDNAQEICYALVSKSTGQIYKPTESDSWLTVIYTWVNPIDGLMEPNELEPIYITRKIYIEKDPETVHLKWWAGKQHYMEYLGGPEPKPVCACCAGTRIPKPSDDEFINSTHTEIIINKPSHVIRLNGKNLHFELRNGNQNKIYINYDGAELRFNYTNWVNNEFSGYHHVYLNLFEGYEFLHSGKYFSSSVGEKKLKLTYPEWVTPNTIWSSTGAGCKSYSGDYCVQKFETDANDYTDNPIICSIFNQVKQIYYKILELIPQDISGDKFKYESNTELNAERMIKYVNLIGLEEIKNKVEEFINFDNMFDQLANVLNNINPIELKLKKLNDKINQTVLELVNKYHVNIENSSDI